MDKVTYKARRQWASLRKLMHEDGYSVAHLAEMAGVAESTFYKSVIGDFDKSEPLHAHHFGCLADELASEFQNYRLLKLDLPPNAKLVIEDNPYRANGLKDELRDMLMAGGTLGEADLTRNPER